MRAPPHVIYAQAKYMWAQGDRDSSLNFLRQFATSLSSDVKTEPSRSGVPRPKYDEISRLLARCYFKQGQWEAELDSEWQSVSRLCGLHLGDYFMSIVAEYGRGPTPLSPRYPLRPYVVQSVAHMGSGQL